jgi:Cd2+-exporting ATPase
MRPRSEKWYHNASPKAKGDTGLNGYRGKAKVPGTTDLCANVCDTEEEPSGSIGKSKEIFTDVAHTADLEKGLSGKEHVILSISGMTCTGCETKLKRALDTVVSVKNLKTSFVLARAEFDLDRGAGFLVKVMKHLERTTEFKCEKVMNQGSIIDLTSPSDSSSFVQQDWPHGVTEMTVIDKKTVQVGFDAEIIGA